MKDFGKEQRLEEDMVGTTGFEPATSRTPSVRATRLRYVPTGVKHRQETATIILNQQADGQSKPTWPVDVEITNRHRIGSASISADSGFF
jgi:hypothetical protein